MLTDFALLRALIFLDCTVCKRLVLVVFLMDVQNRQSDSEYGAKLVGKAGNEPICPPFGLAHARCINAKYSAAVDSDNYQTCILQNTRNSLTLLLVSLLVPLNKNQSASVLDSKSDLSAIFGNFQMRSNLCRTVLFDL